MSEMVEAFVFRFKNVTTGVMITKCGINADLMKIAFQRVPIPARSTRVPKCVSRNACALTNMFAMSVGVASSSKTVTQQVNAQIMKSGTSAGPMKIAFQPAKIPDRLKSVPKSACPNANVLKASSEMAEGCVSEKMSVKSIVVNLPRGKCVVRIPYACRHVKIWDHSRAVPKSVSPNVCAIVALYEDQTADALPSTTAKMLTSGATNQNSTVEPDCVLTDLARITLI